MSDDGFLGRWSKRKQAARDPQPEPEPEPASAAAEPEPEAPPAAAEPATDEPEPELSPEALAELPPIEEAQSSLDLKPYFRKGVPEALQRLARRRAWMLNPAIRDYVDPALDYAWDFNAPAAGTQTFAAGAAKLLGEMAERRQVAQADPPTGGPPAAAGEAPDVPGTLAPARTAVGEVPEAVEALEEPPQTGVGEAIGTAEAGGPQVSEKDGSDDPPRRRHDDPPRRRHGGAVPKPG